MDLPPLRGALRTHGAFAGCTFHPLRHVNQTQRTTGAATDVLVAHLAHLECDPMLVDEMLPERRQLNGSLSFAGFLDYDPDVLHDPCHRSIVFAMNCGVQKQPEQQRRMSTVISYLAFLLNFLMVVTACVTPAAS